MGCSDDDADPNRRKMLNQKPVVDIDKRIEKRLHPANREIEIEAARENGISRVQMITF